MKFLPIYFFLTISIFSQENYFRSNKTGMKLEEVDLEQAESEEFYLYELREKDSNIKKVELYDNEEDELVWEKEVEYKTNSEIPVKISKFEGKIKEIEVFADNGLLVTYHKYRSNELEFYEKSLYDTNDLITSVIRYDESDNILFTDSYFRGSKGELRSVKRESGEEYINHWFYSNGSIIESWFIEGGTRIRTIYSELGDTLSVISYNNEDVSYIEEYSYRDDRVLKSVIRTFGDYVEERFYNSSGLVSELKIKNKDILVKSHLYRYSEDTVISEKITGHGKTEEYLHTLDSNGDVILISYYVDGELKSNTIIESDDKEIKEFFKDGVIYLREYFQDKERIEKELFIDGELFKSEKIVE